MSAFSAMVSGSVRTAMSAISRGTTCMFCRQIDHLVGHEAVPPHDAALGVGAGAAEVRSVVVAGAALGVAARAAHRRHHQIAGLDVRHRGADLDDLAERLVAHHQVRLAGGRHAVLEARDLVIGPADADLQHADPCLIVPLEPGGRTIDQPNLLLGREHGDCTHR